MIRSASSQASQAISKKHCGILVRDGKVYVRDFGSTNGTQVNEDLIKDAEIAIEDGREHQDWSP